MNHLYHRAAPYASECLHVSSFIRADNSRRALELTDFYGVFCVYAGGEFLFVFIILTRLFICLSCFIYIIRLCLRRGWVPLPFYHSNPSIYLSFLFHLYNSSLLNIRILNSLPLKYIQLSSSAFMQLFSYITLFVPSSVLAQYILSTLYRCVPRCCDTDAGGDVPSQIGILTLLAC